MKDPIPSSTIEETAKVAEMVDVPKHIAPSCPEGTHTKRPRINPDEQLQVLRVHENAKLPTRGSPLSAGYDLSACEATIIPSGGRGIVKTGLKIKVPSGCYGRVAPRSGLAVKKGIDVGAGVIDADYRGEVGVVLFNFGDAALEVGVGDRVAQLILEKICFGNVVEVQGLDETERGAGGFGSTGVSQ